MKNEKQLLALPWADCPAIEQKPTEQPERYKSYHYYRFTAELHTPGGEPVLGITVFNMGGTATRRYWISKAQRGMQVFFEEKFSYKPHRVPGKMYGASIDQELPIDPWYGATHVLYSTVENEKAIFDFCGKAESVNKAVSKFMRSQRKAETDQKHERERQKMREWFELLPPIPEEESQWERDCVTIKDRYFFYEYTGRKLQKGWCSHCGAKSELPNVKQFKWGECPHCKSKIMFRSIKWLQNPRHNWYEVMLLQRAGKYIASRILHVHVRHEIKNGVPGTEISHGEYSRQFYTLLLEPAACFSKGPGTFAATVDGFHKDMLEAPARISPVGLEKLRKESGLKAPLETLAERGKLHGRWPEFAKEALRPEIEYLIKLGLYSLCADELYTGYGHKRRLFKGTTATEIIGLPMNEIDKLRRVDAPGGAFDLIRQLYKTGYVLKPEDMQQIIRLDLDQTKITALWEMAQARSMKKALNYIEKQMGSHNGNHVLTEWRDYMGMAKAAGWDINNDMIMFPKHLKKAHDEAITAVEIKKNEKTDRKIRKQAERLTPICWSFDGLHLIPAKSVSDLVKEGRALSHCVGRGGYAEKMARGESAIFFIRRNSAPAEPYVTLELSLKTGKVLQCYGKKDNFPGDKVKKFYLRWEKEIVSKFFSSKRKVKTA